MRKIRVGEENSQKFARELRKNMSDAERKLWVHLRRKQLGGYRFRRQHAIGTFIVDFACVSENLAVEVDGATHSTNEEIAYDTRRTAYLNDNGWKIIRYANEDIYKNIDNVLDDMLAHLRGLKNEYPI